MKQYIDKSALVAEIEKRIEETKGMQPKFDQFWAGQISAFKGVLKILDTLEVKEVDLNNGIQLTWEDVRELYIIFAEVDTEIELCKTDIKTETLGYYQEVLKRFKAQKGE